MSHPLLSGAGRRLPALAALAALAACADPATAPAPSADADPPGAAPVSASYVAGQRYYGAIKYVEYVPGTLPIIVSVGHDGTLVPSSIPDRTSGTTSPDGSTREIARLLSDSLYAMTGQRPYLIVNHLSRRKVEVNRALTDGATAAGTAAAAARTAWTEYHTFIAEARRSVTSRSGKGLYVDLHGHPHAKQRIELGYVVRGSALNSYTDATLSGCCYARYSAFRHVAGLNPGAFASMIRGSSSLGGLYAQRGFPAIPSPTYRAPGSDPYYDGGYSVQRHGSRDGGTVDAVQVEVNKDVRFSSTARPRFAGATARVLGPFLSKWMRLTLPRR